MFSKQRAAELHNHGLQLVRDVWIEERSTICSAEEAARRFGLAPAEYVFWARICHPLAQAGQRFLLRRSDQPSSKEWVGLFSILEAMLPEIVYQGGDVPHGHLTNVAQRLQLPTHHKFYTVLAHSRILVSTPPARGMQPGELWHNGFGFPARVRVQSIT
jgi:hypothetical protein